MRQATATAPATAARLKPAATGSSTFAFDEAAAGGFSGAEAKRRQSRRAPKVLGPLAERAAQSAARCCIP